MLGVLFRPAAGAQPFGRQHPFFTELAAAARARGTEVFCFAPPSRLSGPVPGWSLRGQGWQPAERLFLKTYDLELEGAKSYRIWAYRKAAWTVDEHSESIAELYETEGEAGLRKLPAIGEKLAGRIARWLQEGKAEE